MSIDNHFRDQQDLVRWIENKLGSNELWGGKQASFVLTRDILIELETCFQELEPHIKLKIIQAMVHISPKTLQAWKEPLFNLLEVARRDPDDWVETVADIFRNFPDEGLIQCSSKTDSFFNRTQLELERIVAEKVCSNSDDFQVKLPPDLELIPQSLLKSETSERNKVIKHFEQRERTTITKSAKLLEDVRKSAEQQNNPSNKKNHGLISSFPIKIRSTAKRLDNSLPMKGIPSSASALKMSGGFTNESKKYHQRTLLKRTGGAMLLDIDDLPKQSRRRRNIETITLKKEEQKEQSPSKNSLIKNKSEQNEQNANVSLNVETGESTPVQASLASESISENPQQMTSSLLDSSQNLDIHQLSTNTNLMLPPISMPSMLSIPPAITMEQNTTLSSAGSSSTSQNQHLIYPQPIGQMMATNPFENIPTTNLAALQQFESMLKDANKLTLSSYNLIISFLIGNKHNPFEKDIGPLITLPFSETVEFEPLASGVGVDAILVETYFQMDYRTGEWKRLKNSRALKPDELNQRKDQLFGVNKQFNEQTLINGQCDNLQQMPMFFQPNSQ
uniref:HDAg domain-containing protein n=1 Tax=Meloidogyne incognita TaxID=6306 RepID=A0A914M2B6_MELIC